MKKITADAVLEQMDILKEFVSAELEAIDCSVKVQMQMEIALDEILSNIVFYAYPNGPESIDVSCEASPEQVTVIVEDSGIPYNPLEKEDPDITLSAEERRIGGLGIFMVKKTMDEVCYEYKNNKNILTIKKNIS